jgi:type I restriction-modification system DNA methylase subunit
LDRIIFVCFCEDLNLLPDKIFTKLLKNRQESFVEVSIWQQIKGLFNAIDKGWPQKNINKFNGGLFAKDTELDELVLQDDILKEIIKISDWDFGSELTVNILGHIFEQSITDLEEIKTDISGETHDKKQGKRKKDGVFYTPEYITRYIVEEAVGGWLNDCKNELGIEKLPELTEQDFIKKGKKSSKNAQKHIDFYNSYAKILQNIKVLDPACGSGAFLVAVFNFLENQWLTLSETLRKLGDDEQAGLFSYSQVYKSILKNNIYGVDLNPESVQITKLSLWLKTANRSEELTTLDANIKCGNSLIDDATVETGFYINNEGERVSLAFNWQNEFSHVFESGGFDVVVGNPPYVNAKNMKLSDREFLKEHYNFLQDKWDIYVAFIERAMILMKENALLSYIIPDAFVREKYSNLVREYISNNCWMKKINFLENIKVFENVGVSNIIFVIQKIKARQETENIIRTNTFENITIQNNIEAKSTTDSVQLGDICFISVGMVLNADENKAKGEFTKDDVVSDVKTDIHIKPIIEGDCLDKYLITNNRFLEWNTVRVPHKIRRPTFPELHFASKIVINKVGTIKASYDDVGFACEQTVRVLILWKQLHGVENQSVNNSIKRYSHTSRNSLEGLSEKFDYLYLLFDFSKNIWIKPASFTKQKKRSIVVLNSYTLEILNQMKESINTKDSHIISTEKYLFFNTLTKKPLGDIKRFFANICTQFKIENLRIHDLRHTFASILVSGGVSLEKTGSLIGHSNSNTTQRYAHLSNQSLFDASEVASDKIKSLIKKTNH